MGKPIIVLVCEAGLSSSATFQHLSERHDVEITTADKLEQCKSKCNIEFTRICPIELTTDGTKLETYIDKQHFQAQSKKRRRPYVK